MAPISAIPPAPAPATAGRDPDPHLESGADADGPGSAGGLLRALVFLALGIGLLGVGFWAVKPKPGVGPRPTAMTPGGMVAAAVPDATVLPALVPAQAQAQASPTGTTPALPPVPAPVPAAPAPSAGAASPPPATATIARETLIGNPIELRLSQGEIAHLALTADAPGELHLHGYDLERPTQPGVPVELSFTASQTGRFPIEWHGPHHAHVEVGVVEVYPR